MKFTNLLCFISAVLVISGCNNSGGSTISNNSRQTIDGLIIDSPGVVPVFAGDQTKTVLFIHNNGNQDLNGISYKVDSGSLLIDATNCESIKAGETCELNITTPLLSEETHTGSSIIEASQNGASIRQLIHYALIDENDASQGEFKFSNNLILDNSHNQYHTVYLYSATNRNYHLDQIVSDSNLININKYQEAEAGSKHYITAVEIHNLKNSETIKNSKLSALIHDEDNHNYSVSVPLEVVPMPNGAFLTFGATPVINTLNQRSGSVVVFNSGTESAQISQISYPESTTAANGVNRCNSSLNANAYCYIYFNIESNSSNGSGDLTIHYQQDSTQTLSWYNSKSSVMQVGVTAAQNPILYYNNQAATTITIQNLGQNILESINLSSVPGTISNSNCSRLHPLASCSFTLSEASSFTVAQFKININGNYLANGVRKNYGRKFILLTANATYATINAIASPSTGGVISGAGTIGDPWIFNIGTTAYINFTYTNTGNQPAQNFYVSTTGLSNGWQLFSTTCGTLNSKITFNNGAVCNVTYSVTTSSAGTNNFTNVQTVANWTDQARPNGATLTTTRNFYFSASLPYSVIVTPSVERASDGYYHMAQGQYIKLNLKINGNNIHGKSIRIFANNNGITFVDATGNWTRNSFYDCTISSNQECDVYAIASPFASVGTQNFGFYNNTDTSNTINQIAYIVDSGKTSYITLSHNLSGAAGRGGYATADSLCSFNDMHPTGNPYYVSDVKALLRGNNATIPGRLYWNKNYEPVGIAANGNFDNLVGNVNSLWNPIDAAYQGGVWTGGVNDGPGSNCSNWTTTSGTGEYGMANTNMAGWRITSNNACTATHKHYCVITQ